MPSIISAGTTTGTALSLTSDTSGELQIRTNNGATTALTLTTGGAATFTAGTVSAPAITTTGDTNTGIFFPAADTIAFTEGGVESMRIDSSGNVGIGTSSPVTRLDVVGGTTTIRGAALFNTSSTAGTGSSAYIRSANAFSSATTPDYTWWFNDQCGLFHPASDVIGFTTTGTERMRIDSVGRVGIGTNSPGYRLDVVAPTGNGNTVARFYQSVSGGNTDVYFNNVDNVGDWLVTRRSNGEGWLYMSGSNPIVFYTNATERMRVNAGAPILCLAGGNTSATGTGIAFPATQSASADVNTLDDYEEGTWTPRLEFDGINATSYTTLYGMYTKIGRQVTVSGRLVVNVLGSVGSGLARIYGLPFAAGNFGPSPTFSGSMVSVTTLVAVTGTLGLWIDNNGGISIIPYSNENGSGTFTFGTNYTTGSGYTFTMTYFV
jgi:hypothetical protein